MAADEDKTVVAAAGEPAAAPAKKGSKKLFLFGGIGLGVIVVGVALALFVLKPMMASSGDGADKKADKPKVEKKAEQPKASKSEASTKEGEGGGAFVYAIKDIVVNPAGTGGTRFLSVSFGFDLNSKELAAAFEQREPLVRDVLITILSSKTVAELTDAKQKEIMRLQIRKRLSQLLSTTDLAGVYYTDFVLQ